MSSSDVRVESVSVVEAFTAVLVAVSTELLCCCGVTAEVKKGSCVEVGAADDACGSSCALDSALHGVRHALVPRAGLS